MPSAAPGGPIFGEVPGLRSRFCPDRQETSLIYPVTVQRYQGKSKSHSTTDMVTHKSYRHMAPTHRITF